MLSICTIMNIRYKMQDYEYKMKSCGEYKNALDNWYLLLFAIVGICISYCLQFYRSMFGVTTAF